jgi:uncharacterized SAM-dependent methyltransferase
MNLQLATNHKIENSQTDNFHSDIVEGLKSTPKKLHSKYFYDKAGDRLFQQIMAMPEYYLTDCELDIFKNKTQEITDAITFDESPFDLIELGAGDAMKSSFLLKNLIDNQIILPICQSIFLVISCLFLMKN